MSGVGFFAPNAQAQFSGFATDAEGWSIISFSLLSGDNYSVVGTYGVSYTATGGNPGGFITSSDPDGGDFMFSAPALFLGNQSSAYGSALTYSLNDMNAVNYNTTDVMLVGGGLRLLWQQSPTLSPIASWTTVTAALTPSSQWHVGTTTGALASTSDFMTVLGNLTGLYIRGEYATGPDSPGLDNVQFGLVPEPGTFALLSMGLISLGLLAKGRRSRQRRG